MEPIAYKFVGKYYTWLVTEIAAEELEECCPMYAPIEDEI